MANVRFACHVIPMDANQVRTQLRRATEKAGTALNWARAHDVSTAYLSDVMTGKRQPGEKILDALGLERVVTYRRKPSPRP